MNGEDPYRTPAEIAVDIPPDPRPKKVSKPMPKWVWSATIALACILIAGAPKR